MLDVAVTLADVLHLVSTVAPGESEPTVAARLFAALCPLAAIILLLVPLVIWLSRRSPSPAYLAAARDHITRTEQHMSTVERQNQEMIDLLSRLVERRPPEA